MKLSDLFVRLNDARWPLGVRPWHILLIPTPFIVIVVLALFNVFDFHVGMVIVFFGSCTVPLVIGVVLLLGIAERRRTINVGKIRVRTNLTTSVLTTPVGLDMKALTSVTGPFGSIISYALPTRIPGFEMLTGRETTPKRAQILQALLAMFLPGLDTAFPHLVGRQAILTTSVPKQSLIATGIGTLVDALQATQAVLNHQPLEVVTESFQASGSPFDRIETAQSGAYIGLKNGLVRTWKFFSVVPTHFGLNALDAAMVKLLEEDLHVRFGWSKNISGTTMASMTIAMPLIHEDSEDEYLARLKAYGFRVLPIAQHIGLSCMLPGSVGISANAFSVDDRPIVDNEDDDTADDNELRVILRVLANAVRPNILTGSVPIGWAPGTDLPFCVAPDAAETHRGDTGTQESGKTTWANIELMLLCEVFLALSASTDGRASTLRLVEELDGEVMIVGEDGSQTTGAAYAARVAELFRQGKPVGVRPATTKAIIPFAKFVTGLIPELVDLLADGIDVPDGTMIGILLDDYSALQLMAKQKPAEQQAITAALATISHLASTGAKPQVVSGVTVHPGYCVILTTQALSDLDGEEDRLAVLIHHASRSDAVVKIGGRTLKLNTFIRFAEVLDLISVRK